MVVYEYMAYGKLAEVYDLMMRDVDYEGWVEYVLTIWKKLNFRPERVLDLGCGTGNAAIPLSKRGFKVIGVDLSKDMLKVAKKKSKGLGIKYLQADMSKLKLGSSFDAVVCLYDSLNYLLQESKVQSAFWGVYKILNPGGIFIFDVYTIKKLSQRWEKNKKCIDFGNLHVCCRDSFDKQMLINTLYLDLFLKNQNGKYERFNEVHKERGYSLSDLRSWLEKVGFKFKGMYNALTFDKPTKESNRVYFVAQKSPTKSH